MIAVFVPVRLKSKRLKLKALKKISNTESIKWCLNCSSQIKKIKRVFLLTSFLKKDDGLTKIKYKKGIKVFRGDPTDLFKRFLDAARKYKVKTIIRVTGDCPFISKEIMNYLLKSHLKKKADYTAAKKYAVGTSGEIINVMALENLYKKIKDRSFSEYMPFYFLNNQNLFKINIVNLPRKYVRGYRLTLDYAEDLKMFNFLVKKLIDLKLEINLKNIFRILDQNKKIAKINEKKKLVYKSKVFIKKIKKFTKLTS